jgi:hypothetical protein
MALADYSNPVTSGTFSIHRVNKVIAFSQAVVAMAESKCAVGI